MKKKIVYAEPADYFPKELRKKYKLGEYAEDGIEVEMKVTIKTNGDTIKADGVEELESILESLEN